MRSVATGILLGILLICTIKHCVEQPAPVPVHSMAVFKDLRSAELYAARRAVQCSTVYECGGDIFLTPLGEYVVSRTHSDYAGDELRGIDYNLPESWKAVADFHTHACLPTTHITDRFSDADATGNTAQDTEGVLVDLCTGEVHLFVPGKTPIGERLSHEVHDVPGEIIAHLPVSGTVVDPDQGY